MVKAHGKAGTQNRPGHNITKGTAGKGGNTNSIAEGKEDGDGQTKDADHDEGYE